VGRGISRSVAAYINSLLNELILMRARDDFNLPPGFGLRLKRSIYGLKQSGLNWHLCISEFFTSLGFTKLLSDSYIFTMNHGREDFFIITLYVDDMLLAYKLLDEVLKMKRKIKERFDIDDMREVKFYLGLKITRDYQSNI
jgi:hypothetical protein